MRGPAAVRQAREKSRGYPANPAVSPRYRNGCFIRSRAASDNTATEINALRPQRWLS